MKEVLDEVKKWIRVLDKEDSAEQQNIFFYNVRHGTAEELSDALGVFFNTSGASSTKSANTTKSSSSKAKPTTGSTASTKTTTKSTAKKTLEDGEQETIFDAPVVVYADTTQNRLVIKASGRSYALINAMLGRLDQPLPQVMIQAIIADVTLSHNTEFGFAYAAKHMTGSSDFLSAGTDQASTSWLTSTSTTVDDETTSTTTSTPFEASLITRQIGGIAASWMKGDSIGFINAVAGKGNTRVLSAPQILAATGEEAMFSVGRQVAIRTSEYTTTSTVAQANYEYQDTGTILTVTPYVTAGNEVRVVLKQEVSDVVDDNTENPDINKKELTSTLVIPDGGTIMMGGLISSTASDGYSGVPFLMNIPVLGWLFKTHAKNDSRNELIVLITVNVVNNDIGTDALASRYKTALEEISKQMDF
jgi:general secretion pathway protein D